MILLIRKVIILNKRIKELRKTLGLTQESFAQKIGITKSSVSLLESGQNKASAQTIYIISKEFNVNEEWLRTGKGEMFNAAGDDELSYLVGQLCGSDDEFKKEFVKTLCKLSDKQWKVLKEFVDEVYLNTKKDK